MEMIERGSDILAFTVSFGDRDFLQAQSWSMRATAGCWYDHAVYLGAPSDRLRSDAQQLLDKPDRTGIQYLTIWDENRGQHHATLAALALAREREYKWLLRLDDDVRPKTKKWLSQMVQRMEELRRLSGDEFYRFVCSPKIIGLRNQIEPIGTINVGQPYTVELVPILGGACRLHPVSLLERYKPDIYDPVGRLDPQGLAEYLLSTLTAGTGFIRFPDIRVQHNTDEIEAQDSPAAAHARKMSYFWPYLGPEV